MDAPLIYCDTCIFINCLKDETSPTGKQMGREAFRLFKRSASCKYRIAISDWLLNEIYKKASVSDAKLIFTLIKNKITEKVIKTEEDIARAKELSPSHFQDALHVVLAMKAGADIFVTRDFELRKNLGHLIEIKLPEELI